MAIRLTMWHWLDYTGNQEWFDVPCANFYAWSIVLCLCSALLWQGRPLTMRPGWRGPLAALDALLGSVMILALLDELVVQYDRRGGDGPTCLRHGRGGVTDFEYQVPLFVLTHHIPEKVAKGQNDQLTLTFVTSGIEKAIDQAKAAAGDKHIMVIGGANTAQ